jgi:Zn-dependent peptidase ImmA (M78 family)
MDRSQVFHFLRERRSENLGNTLFVEFAKSHGQPPTPVLIEQVVRTLGIELEKQTAVANGYLVSELEQYKIIVNKNRSEPITRFTIAHELAHWFLRQRVGIDDSTGLGNADKEVLERACDQFASRLLAPDYAIVRDLEKARNEISISALERLAVNFRVPLRAVIASLRSSGILNVAETAVIVLKPMKNPATGNQWDIRIWQAALPWWGFLPQFKRIDKIGLRNICREWPSLPFNFEVTLNEEISVSERCRSLIDSRRRAGSNSSGSKATWSGRITRTVAIAYKTYGNPDEGLFVVGVFPWAKPRAMRSEQ